LHALHDLLDALLNFAGRLIDLAFAAQLVVIRYGTSGFLDAPLQFFSFTSHDSNSSQKVFDSCGVEDRRLMSETSMQVTCREEIGVAKPLDFLQYPAGKTARWPPRGHDGSRPSDGRCRVPLVPAWCMLVTKVDCRRRF
jgi:hypothetical protein